MWNYRVVKKKQTWVDPTSKQESRHYSYAIHEAYYDHRGYVGAITWEPVEPYGETIEELRHAWIMMAEAFGQPILDYDMIPESGYNREEDPLGGFAERVSASWAKVGQRRKAPEGSPDELTDVCRTISSLK